MRNLVALLTLAACTPSRAVKPLPKGVAAMDVAIGGPLNGDLGAVIPLPLVSLGGAYGLDGRTTVHGAVHPTGLVAVGLFGLSGGVSTELWRPKGASPRLMASADLAFFAGDAAAGAPEATARLFVDPSLVASWDLGEHSLYTGVHLFVQPAPTWVAHVTPMAGVQLRHQRVGVQFEAVWLAPYVANEPLASRWVGIGGQGALQFKLGTSINFGRGTP